MRFPERGSLILPISNSKHKLKNVFHRRHHAVFHDYFGLCIGPRWKFHLADFTEHYIWREWLSSRVDEVLGADQFD